MSRRPFTFWDIVLLPITAPVAVVLVTLAFCVDTLLVGPGQGFRTAALMLSDVIHGPDMRGDA